MSKKPIVVPYTERSGYLYHSSDGKTWNRVYGILKRFTLTIQPERKDSTQLASASLQKCNTGPLDPSRVSRRFAFHVDLDDGNSFWFATETKDDCEQWLSCIMTSSIPPTWPGGVGHDKRPRPLMYTELLRKLGQSPLAVISSINGSGNDASAASVSPDPNFQSPLVDLPRLDAVPLYQQRALVLRKLRICSVVFDIPDTAVAHQEKDLKRQTLTELVEMCDKYKHLAQDFRVLEEIFYVIRMNLFRALPIAPEPIGDPDEEEEPFMDPQWPHLAATYELLLKLASLDHIEVAAKKKVIDASFVRQLLLLFDSEDMRERDYLKTITHRIYSKLTQRRALVRRVICNIFFEFVFESGRHNGIAEMLEILASIINGFAVPIKEEHKIMLVRALLPLHKAKDVVTYHPQLSYCMALYVAKDHQLTRQVVPGLLKYWPVCNSAKQIMFLNELDDVFEYVQSDDLVHFQTVLAHRLAKCIGSLHFQVSERTLCLWNSNRFAHLMVEQPQHRHAALPIFFDALIQNSRNHWHESVQTMSGQVLDQYLEADADLYRVCHNIWEQKQNQRDTPYSTMSPTTTPNASTKLVIPKVTRPHENNESMTNLTT